MYKTLYIKCLRGIESCQTTAQMRVMSFYIERAKHYLSVLSHAMLIDYCLWKWKHLEDKEDAEQDMVRR